jgi:SPX domain protein involved in polyphosphate accumulation
LRLDYINNDEWRFERKFFIENHSEAEVINSIKQHPAIFNGIFHSRQVNNVYFDSLEFKNYLANMEGDAEREKIRVRWYGERFGKIENPVLEIKTKMGYLGRKEYYPLKAFTMDEKSAKFDLLKMMVRTKLPRRIRYDVRSLLPLLANSYMRQYFLSADKRLRLTVDTDIRCFQIDHLRARFQKQILNRQSIVMELKYSSSDEIDFYAREVANNFKFRVTKNSKYVGGVNEVYFG